MIDYPLDQGAVAWGNVLPQHRNKPQLEGFFKAFYKPTSDLIKAFKDLRELRGLDTATGVQLDNIGSIVGVSRIIPKAIYLAFFGYSFQSAGRGYGQARYRKPNENFANSFTMADNEYRNLIKAKIIQNNSHGTVEEIIAACKLLFNAAKVKVSRSGTAALAIEITTIDYYTNRQVNGKLIVPFPTGSYALGGSTTDLGAVADTDGTTKARRFGSSAANGANVYIARTAVLPADPGANYNLVVRLRSNAAAPTIGSIFAIDEYNAASAASRLNGLPLTNSGITSSWKTFNRSFITKSDTVSFQVYYLEGFQTGAEIEIYDCQISRIPLPGETVPNQLTGAYPYLEQFLPISAGISFTTSYLTI